MFTRIGIIEIHIEYTKNMKVCILGSYAGRLDEGMTNVAYNVYAHLRSTYSNLYLFNVQEVYGLEFWNNILKIKPDIIHYFPGPTFKGLVLVKLIQLLTRSHSVISAIKPVLPDTKLFRIISYLLKPDIVLVQSRNSETLFTNIKYKIKFIPNGVDTERFTPVNFTRKAEIRKKYGFSTNDFIVLHIGPIKSGRNQKSLLQIEDAKLLLIVSITNPSEQKAYNELTKTNATIWKEYFPNIEEIYAMADVYVWPVLEELNGIEIPLTVLEAMSCNLPVISTQYGALGRIFQQGEGLIFIANEKEIQKSILKIKNDGIRINTREKVKSFSWKNVADEIAEVYEDITRYGKV